MRSQSSTHWYMSREPLEDHTVWLLPIERPLLALFVGGGLVIAEAEGAPEISSQCYGGSESANHEEDQGEKCAVRSVSYWMGEGRIKKEEMS